LRDPRAERRNRTRKRLRTHNKADRKRRKKTRIGKKGKETILSVTGKHRLKNPNVEKMRMAPIPPKTARVPVLPQTLHFQLKKRRRDPNPPVRRRESQQNLREPPLEAKRSPGTIKRNPTRKTRGTVVVGKKRRNIINPLRSTDNVQ
jgi:type VI protein secretion system component VasA